MLLGTIITALVQLSLVAAVSSVNHDEVVAEVKTALTNLTQTNSTVGRQLGTRREGEISEEWVLLRSGPSKAEDHFRK